jgi:hypothetical protein
MTVWDDIIEQKATIVAAGVDLILEDGERYLGMDVSFYPDNRPYFDVSCESWRGAILKNDGDNLILLTHEVYEGLKSLEGSRVPVKVEW